MGRTACTEPPCLYKGALHLYLVPPSNMIQYFNKSVSHQHYVFLGYGVVLLCDLSSNPRSPTEGTLFIRNVGKWLPSDAGDVSRKNGDRKNTAKKNSTHLFTSKGKGKGQPCNALRLCTGRTAHRGNRRIALLFHDHGTRKG
jgi:hypothetical protein